MQAIARTIRFQVESFSSLSIGTDADEKLLRQVLLNLLGIAVKFTEQGRVTSRICSECPCLEVPVERLPIENSNLIFLQCLRFEVSDIGLGLTPAQLEKNFRPLKQVGDAQSQAAGDGLGLAMKQHWVALMDGVKAASEWGKGSSFWLEGIFPGVIAPPELTTYQTKRVAGFIGLAGQDDRHISLANNLKDLVQGFPEKAIAILAKKYLYPERNL